MNRKLVTSTVLISLTILIQSRPAFSQTTGSSLSENETNLVSEVPPCFMIASDGRMIDLTALCNTPSPNNPTSRTPSQPSQNSGLQPSQRSAPEGQQNEPENPQDADPQFAPYDADSDGVG